jgi:hypothetical protein
VLETFLIVLVAAAAVLVILYAAWLTYTAICIIAGIGIGVVLMGLIVYRIWQKQQVREDKRRDREYSMMVALMNANRYVPVDDEILPPARLPASLRKPQF